MLNLLQQREQQAIHTEYYFRLSVVVLAFVAILGVCGIVALTPALFVSYAKHNVSEQAKAVLVKKGSAGTIHDFDTLIKVTKEKTSVLNSFSTSEPVNAIIETILASKVPEIKINALSLSLTESGGHTIGVIGRSSDRNTLLNFVHRLEKDALFTKVDLPISNFAAATDIDFSLTLTSNK